MSKADGKYIAIQFTQPLTNEFTGAEAAAFSVTGQVYDMVPEGELIAGDFQVDTVERYPTPRVNVIRLVMKDLKRFHNIVGDLTVAYDGSGGLMGAGGSVAAFAETFTPTDLVPKPDIHEPVHIEILNAIAAGNLMLIEYTNMQDDGSENHLELLNAVAAGTLTHVNDI